MFQGTNDKTILWWLANHCNYFYSIILEIEWNDLDQVPNKYNLPLDYHSYLL